MYGPIEIPFGAKLLFNEIRLRPGVSMDEVELALAELCNLVRGTYGNEKGGFIAGQVFRFSGFVSEQGSLLAKPADEHLAIVTYWHSYEQHERSHADAAFQASFSALTTLCTESRELGYEMLWQGASERAAAT